MKIEQEPIVIISKGEKKEKEYAFTVREGNGEQSNKKQHSASMQERQEIQFAQRSNLQCMKTQLIYREIINPLYTTKYLHEEQRSTIQFLYLLLVRCFNNMSLIQFELEKKHKDKEIMKNLQQQITPLYNQVNAKFIEFSDKLTKTQNKYTSIIGDFFKKKMDKSNFEEKDRFLTGIETINYSKEEQIQYTYKYYTMNIQKQIQGINNLSNVIKRLNKYVEINGITKQSLDAQRRDFITVVKDLLK